MKYVEVLNDLQILDQNFYLKVKYGTDDPNMVCMLKNGFSLNIAHLLLTQYNQYLSINPNTNEVLCSPKLIDAMEEQKENPIQILEVKSYL